MPERVHAVPANTCCSVVSMTCRKSLGGISALPKRHYSEALSWQGLVMQCYLF